MKFKSQVALMFIIGMNLTYAQSDNIVSIEKQKEFIDSIVNNNQTYVFARPQLEIAPDFVHEDNPTYLVEHKNSGLTGVFNYYIPNGYVCRIDIRTQHDSTYTFEKVYFNSKGQIIYSETRNRSIYYGSKLNPKEKPDVVDRIWIKDKIILKFERETIINGISNSKEIIELTPYKTELLFRVWDNHKYLSSDYINRLPIKIDNGYTVEVVTDQLKIQMKFRSSEEYITKVGGDVNITIIDEQNRQQSFFIKNSSFSYNKDLFKGGVLKITKEEFENTNTVSGFEKRSPIEYLDFNFDGFKDIAIFTNSSMGFENYNLFLFNKESNLYKYYPLELGGAVAPQKFGNKVIPAPLIIDSIKRVIQIKYSWAFPWEVNGTRDRAYIWDNGILRLVYERTRYRLEDEPNIFVETWRNIKSGQWEVFTKKMKFVDGAWVEFKFNEEGELEGDFEGNSSLNSIASETIYKIDGAKTFILKDASSFRFKAKYLPNNLLELTFSNESSEECACTESDSYIFKVNGSSVELVKISNSEGSISDKAKINEISNDLRFTFHQTSGYLDYVIIQNTMSGECCEITEGQYLVQK